jgi:hypothetical protein
LELGDAQADAVAVRQAGRAGDAAPVHPGAVEGAEVLDLGAVAAGADGGVAAGDLGVLDDQVDTLAPEHELSAELDAAPGHGAGGEQEGGHPWTLQRDDPSARRPSAPAASPRW